jgi:hypothetical protein
MLTLIGLMALLLLALVVLGIVQAVRLIARLFTGPARKYEAARSVRSGTDHELRRLLDRGLISPEVYSQISLALDASRGNFPVDSAAEVAVVPPMARVVAPPESHPPRSHATVPPPLPKVFSNAQGGENDPVATSADRGGLLASFLERRNIRWGELLGGLLILGCSTALVVSFWAQIADRPIFKFALFTVATAAFFGVGLYSEHRWKLPTTSRAILLLATMLVPVNLLAFSALAGPRDSGEFSIIAQVVSLSIFTLLVWPAARVLARGSSVLLTVGLSANCVTLIFIASHAEPTETLLRLAAMPAGCLLICSAIMSAKLWRIRSIGRHDAISACLVLGVIGFATWLAVGFLIFTAPQLNAAAGALSPIFTALAIPAFVMGLIIWKRADTAADYRTAISGLSLAIFGTAILLIGLIAAWPAPGRLVPMGAFDALLMLGAAIVFDLPAAYVVAVSLGALAWLIGFHTWPGWLHGGANDVERVMNALEAGDNGWLLLPMAVLLGAGSMLTARWRNAHATTLGGLALVVAAASFALANIPLLTDERANLLDPACFDLLLGGGFLLLWLIRRDAGRWWAGLGTFLPVLMAEVVAIVWDGAGTGELIRHLMPMLPIAVCVVVPLIGALHLWSGPGVVRPGMIAGLGLLETVGVLLLARWYAVDGDWQQMIPLLGHQATAWAVLAGGVLLRKRFELISAASPAMAPSADERGKSVVVEYLSSTASALRGRQTNGLTAETVAWTIFAGALGCLAIAATTLFQPRPAAAAAMGMCILAATTACWAEMPNGLFIAGALFNVACSIAMFIPPFNRFIRGEQLGSANALFLCIGGGVALVLDRTIFAGRAREKVRVAGFHVVAGWLALVGLFLLWGMHWGFGSLAARRPDWVMCTALASVAALFRARLTDREAVDPVAGIYFTGLLATACVISCLSREKAMSATVWGIALGLYGLLSAGIGKVGIRITRGQEWRRRWTHRWLVMGSAILGAFAVAGAMYGDWSGEGRTLAVFAAVVAMAQSVGLGLLARESRAVRQAALSAIALGMVALAWAMMPAENLTRGLDAAAAASGALAAFAVGAAVARRFVDEAWRSAITPVLALAIGAVAVGAIGIVAGEVADYASGSAPLISTWAVIGIECGLVIGFAGAVAAMGWSGASPSARSACVWAAEALGVLAFVHLRITEPWLFNHRIERYWPVIVLGLAFCLLTAGTALGRRGRAELGKPMEYSGIGWPVVAIVGYWLHPTIVDYSAVLWIAGILYGIVAALRRSLSFSLIAVACVNGALWVVFSRHPESSFFSHPQLWIIPAALSVLGATQIHHRKLGAEQTRTVRYTCLAAIYLSSTADIVLNGVVIEPWLPMVLAGLAIAGVLAGIAWRVRPFLYLGMTFLMIAVLTMIWTAQQDLHWTWLWYVAGLGTGVALLVLFGLFEKRHEQMTRLLEGLKQWQ